MRMFLKHLICSCSGFACYSIWCLDLPLLPLPLLFFSLFPLCDHCSMLADYLYIYIIRIDMYVYIILYTREYAYRPIRRDSYSPKLIEGFYISEGFVLNLALSLSVFSVFDSSIEF